MSEDPSFSLIPADIFTLCRVAPKLTTVRWNSVEHYFFAGLSLYSESSTDLLSFSLMFSVVSEAYRLVLIPIEVFHLDRATYYKALTVHFSSIRVVADIFLLVEEQMPHSASSPARPSAVLQVKFLQHKDGDELLVDDFAFLQDRNRSSKL